MWLHDVVTGMVVLDVGGPPEEQWKQYLEDSQVLPSLECGIEEMLRACADAAGTGNCACE